MNKIMALGLALALAAAAHPRQEQKPRITAGIKVDKPLRDPCICRGPDGAYYLTGSVAIKNGADGRPDFHNNDGVYLWKSSGLKTWAPLGCVMALRDQPYELYGPYRWLHKVQAPPDEPAAERVFGIVAPEIHFARGTFWLTISMSRQGTALMKSTSGNAEGPYELVDLLTTRGGDPSLFADGEGMWWVIDGGYLAKLISTKPGKHTPPGRKEALALEPRPILQQPKPGADGFPVRLGERGAFLVRDGSTFHMIATERALKPDGTMAWDSFLMSADSPTGPWGPRRLLIPGGGQATLFQNEKGAWLAACSDASGKPVIVEVQL